MFKLKGLHLLGFKSFADRSRLEFGDGIVAVVGPNGCGKSNLADAISWVLGEQSARSLRGERMADVIFNGTGSRPATSMAEVSLTLVDPEYLQANADANGETSEGDSERDAAATKRQGLPSEIFPQTDAAGSGDSGDKTALVTRRAPRKHRPGEIAVTRRLFRSGESEYLINGETCRLRDIQDLFMGTGLGPESYAIIEQGRIGQILSTKPSDRRAIIEEAAGISKFKARKHLAEAKLESSRQNLARITDILEEVTKQVNSLKRQASKARRYREMQAELRDRLKLVLTSRLTALEAECSQLREHVATIHDEGSRAAQQLEALEREEREATLRHEELEDQLIHLRERLAQGELERERLQGRIEHVRQQVVRLAERAADASRAREELQNQLATLEQELREATLQAEQVQQEWNAAKAAAARVLARQEEICNQVSQTEKEVEVCRQSLLEAVSQAAELRNQLIQAEEAGLALDRQATRAEAEKLSAERERARLATELETFLAEHQREESVLAGLAQSVLETSAAVEKAREEEALHHAKLDTSRQELSAAAARKQALEESLARHAYTTENVRRLLSRNIPTNGHTFRPLGVLADFLEVTPGYEEVVEEFLKQELECVVVERHAEARSGIELLRNEGSGRSTFFVTQIPANEPANGHSEADLRTERGVVAAVRDLVRFEPRLGLNGDVALPALENAYVVEDAAAAERLASVYANCHFLTPSGEHYHHRLVAGGRGTAAGPLALRREFRQLEKHTAELEASLRRAEIALSDTAASLARLDEDLRNLTAAKLEAEKKTVLANEKLRQLREACARAAERERVLQAEAVTLMEERKALRVRESSLRVELEAASSAQTQREQEIAQATSKLRGLRAELDRLTQELIEAQARSSALEERTRAVEAERLRVLAQAEEMQARLARLGEQDQGWREEEGRLTAEEESLRARLTDLGREQQSERENLHGLETESQGARSRREELRPSVEAARTALDALREKRSEAEIALARVDSDHGHLVEKCRAELHAEPATLLAEITPEKALAGESLQVAEEQARELAARLENLGPVNMMALEELQEAEERYSFLETQRQDLLASIGDTTQAIREIDQVSRQQFNEAFTAVNGYFAETFRTLFGGGVGQMRFSDESDLESGIDIVAQPPGKRLQNVLLLSGGEKALAALALLIAIFRYRPSPFCVLDEVDAPLDESNIERFTRLIRQMSRHTQFILITHNKQTMEISQAMYGVTMEEPGISRIVSVLFGHAEREPALVSA